MFAAFRDPVHLVIRGESKIVGHACLIERWLQVAEGVPMRTAFVEAVATDPEYQGRGFGSALMRRIMLEAEAHQFEIGGLSTGRIDYYRRLGWELWRGPLCYRLQGRVVSMPEENGAMVYRLSRTPALDLDRPLSVEWREGPEVW
jgi:aminoglycoside 2'-N-acetyltransferase I